MGAYLGTNLLHHVQGQIQEFNLGGGGAKDYVHVHTSQART